jgi:hypothetical protein
MYERVLRLEKTLMQTAAKGRPASANSAKLPPVIAEKAFSASIGAR